MKTLALMIFFVPVFAMANEPVDDEVLFQARCAGLCHQLPEPSMLKAKQWSKVLTVMQKRMQQRGVAPMSESEHAQLLTYLQKNSRQ